MIPTEPESGDIHLIDNTPGAYVQLFTLKQLNLVSSFKRQIFWASTPSRPDLEKKDIKILHVY